MKRRDFFLTSTGLAAMGSLSSLKNLTDRLKNQDVKMPVLFIGHGSPMNAIEDNAFSQRWKKMGKEIPLPKAVLVVSAHWLTQGTLVTAMDKPKTIHDFGGFPKELFQVEYPALGSPSMALVTKNLVKSTTINLDHDWGLDHGTWSVVKHMYPAANVPVYQLSIDYYQSPQYHYNLGKELAELRKKGVLIIGSGNMVHNLGKIKIPQAGFSAPFGFDWALEINEIFKKNIKAKNHKDLINFPALHKQIDLAIPTPDHYYPLLYTLGLQDNKDKVEIFNDVALAGSITMTSLKIG
jgi:4,5-DOPA dioxygenase extradiol